LSTALEPESGGLRDQPTDPWFTFRGGMTRLDILTRRADYLRASRVAEATVIAMSRMPLSVDLGHIAAVIGEHRQKRPVPDRSEDLLFIQEVIVGVASTFHSTSLPNSHV
jgi:hypothetical protein